MTRGGVQSRRDVEDPGGALALRCLHRTGGDGDTDAGQEEARDERQSDVKDSKGMRVERRWGWHCAIPINCHDRAARGSAYAKAG